MKNRHITRYNKLVNHYLENVPKYGEYHHIKPKCMGGTNDISNIVKLPAQAHYIAHYLLCKAYPNNKRLKHAFAMMFVNNPYQDRKQTGKLYELSKIERSKALKGVPRPEYVKQKLRKPKSNTDNYFKPKSKQHAINIGKAKKGVRHKRGVCIYCSKEASVPNISRWHDDNCRFK